MSDSTFTVRERWILAACITASSVVFIDMTVVNLALPTLQADLDATFADMQWVVESYMLLLVSVMLVGGALADALGRRRVLLAGAFAFGVSSVAAGLAQDAATLIVARAVQGLGGALLAPASLAIVSASFHAERRGHALGLWAGFTGVSAALAPPLAGVLMSVWSWRAVFYINVPVLVAVVLITVWRLAPDTVRPSLRAVDLPGALLALAALTPLTHGLLNAGLHGLAHPVTLVSLALSVPAAIGFIAVERRVSAPMLPLGLFADRVFAGLNLMTLVLFTGIGGVMFFMPMVLIQAHGYSPLQAGAAMMPAMVLMFTLAPRMGRWADLHGARWPLALGPLLSAAAFAHLAWRGDFSYLTGVLPSILLMGAGFGTWVTPLTSAVLGAVPEDRSGIASGINTAVARLAQLLAIAVLGLAATAVFSTALDERLLGAGLGAVDLDRLDDQRAALGGLVAPDDWPQALRASVAAARDHAFSEAFRVVAALCAALCVLGAAIGHLTYAGAASPSSAGR